MTKVFLDNAATTPMHPKVIEVMHQSMLENFGNPSSTHQFGRKAKTSIETARKNIAKHLCVTPSEIIFTASGTEAVNFILTNAVVNLGVTKIVTSKIEHHAVLKCVAHLKKTYNIEVVYVALTKKGTVNLQSLEEILANSTVNTLVSLMYVNNEIGTVLDVNKVATICKQYKALFYSDAVQAIGHYPINLQQTPIDFISASAHKFHGPKGVGFAYFKKQWNINPLFYGGQQEKGVRAGTENVHAILGMEKALELALENLEQDRVYITNLKHYFITQLQSLFPGVQFNGDSSSVTNSSYTIVNVCFPFTKKMFLFSLDLAGIAVSGGSACQSGSNKPSHVLQAILTEEALQKTAVRFSFSKFTTKQELDSCLQVLKTLK